MSAYSEHTILEHWIGRGAKPVNQRRLRWPSRFRDAIAEAAALWESLSQIHPFVDGNKRTAFAAAYTFLYINGVEIAADDEATWRFLSPLYAENSVTFEALDAWLRENTRTV